ncbi:MAG: WXG100 family type VII secretion target [Oscillospiraceae bacterium]|nr:WXG100 family type VII secretion target [Oscillospiraceae bacterium]
MALTRQLIEITFGNAMAQARQLDQCAEDMLKVANSNMGSIKGDISAAWQGESANAYLQKMDLTAANIVKTARRLQDIAQTLRNVATIFRNTELRAIELAEQRTY